MKSKLISIALGLLFTVSAAVAEPWRLNEDSNYVTYSTTSLGKESFLGAPFVKTQLTFMCAKSGWEKMTPEMVVYWNFDRGTAVQVIDAYVDDRRIYTAGWRHDGPEVFKPLSDLRILVQAMKVGRKLRLDWQSEGYVKKSTTFDLVSMNIGEFNRACKIQI